MAILFRELSRASCEDSDKVKPVVLGSYSAAVQVEGPANHQF